MEHLISFEEFGTLTRIVSQHLDEYEVERYIEECEDVYIIPAIGLDVWDDVMAGGQKDLLNGCVYVDCCGNRHKCKGLKSAVAYYVYAKLAMNDGSIVSRSGFMQHVDERAQRASDRQRVDRYNDVMKIADKYLAECVLYIKENINKCVEPMRGNGTHIISIGD